MRAAGTRAGRKGWKPTNPRHRNTPTGKTPCKRGQYPAQTTMPYHGETLQQSHAPSEDARTSELNEQATEVVAN